MGGLSDDIMIDKGTVCSKHSVELESLLLWWGRLPSGLLTAPLRHTFHGINLHLEYYDDDVLTAIIRRSAKDINVLAMYRRRVRVATRSRGTPHVPTHFFGV